MALLAGAGGGYWLLARPSDGGGASSGMPAPLIEVTEVASTDGYVLRQTGFVRASDAVEVAPEMTERIVRVAPAFGVGNRIAKGDVLIRLDDTSADADLQAARARVAQAEVARNETRMTLERQQELRREDVVSTAALEDAQVALARAEADLAMARAEAARAALVLDDTVLRAPFDAIVVRESASVGQLVQAGASLGRLVATDSVEVEMGLLRSDLAPAGGSADLVDTRVSLHDPASGRALGQGRVSALLPGIDTRTRTLRLLVRVPTPFDGDGPRLRLDELVDMRLSLPVEGGRALALRAEAVKGGDTVWRVADGTIAPIPVEILSRDGNRVSLRGDGLRAGDRVMLSDLAAPVDGLEVRVAGDARQVAEGD